MQIPVWEGTEQVSFHKMQIPVWEGTEQVSFIRNSCNFKAVCCFFFGTVQLIFFGVFKIPDDQKSGQ